MNEVELNLDATQSLTISLVYKGEYVGKVKVLIDPATMTLKLVRGQRPKLENIKVEIVPEITGPLADA